MHKWSHFLSSLGQANFKSRFRSRLVILLDLFLTRLLWLRGDSQRLSLGHYRWLDWSSRRLLAGLQKQLSFEVHKFGIGRGWLRSEYFWFLLRPRSLLTFFLIWLPSSCWCAKCRIPVVVIAVGLAQNRLRKFLRRVLTNCLGSSSLMESILVLFDFFLSWWNWDSCSILARRKTSFSINIEEIPLPFKELYKEVVFVVIIVGFANFLNHSLLLL